MKSLLTERKTSYEETIHFTNRLNDIRMLSSRGTIRILEA